MRFALLVFAATAMLLSLSACAREREMNARWGGPAPDAPEAKLLHFAHGGLARDYWLHVPERAKARDARSMPLVMALHGGGGDGFNMQRLSAAKLNALADREGFIVCYPSGVERHWNDGRAEVSYRSHVEKIDDVGFLVALVKDLVKRFPIDETRIFATGMSNGSMMSHRLALEASELFAAVAPVGGGLPESLGDAPPPVRPVSILEIRGTADPLVPYAGGKIGFARQRKQIGRVLGAEATAAWWVKADGCTGKPEEGVLPDDADDGCRSTTKRWTGGREGREVMLVTIHGGGHTWPGGYQYLRPWLIGPTCRDWDACEVIWEFFARNRRAPQAR